VVWDLLGVLGMVTKQILRAASGWLELGMPDDALEELKGLTKEEGETRKATELRMAAQMAQGDWKSAGETGLELCEMAVDEPDFHLSAAYCLHEAGETKEAMRCLEEGPEVLEEMAIFHYNKACYLCVMGDVKGASECLARAIEMDDSFQEAAMVDKDLVGLKV
jgi:tetratricopeptide (TPR) repeat protein